MIENIYKIDEVIKKSTRAVVVSHINPDGDAIGSAIAFNNMLKIVGVESRVILPNPPAPNLRILDGVDDMMFFFENKGECSKYIKSCDLIVCVDFNSIKDRIGDMRDPILSNKSSVKLLVDHHQLSLYDGFDVVVSDPSQSSTAILVYRIFKELGYIDKIELSAAQALYVGMMTDTGNFTFGNLEPYLFRAVAELVERGVKPNTLYSKIFNSQTESQIRLRAYALSEKLYINRDLKCGYIVLNKEELARFDFVEGDLEGLVNIPLSIEGVVNSAIFIEKHTLTKISFRSLIEGMDVNKFAGEYFNGGGHINAAGGKSYEPIECAVEFYLEKMNCLYNIDN